MFAWAIGEGLAETNPVNGTNKASESKSRERVLSDAELAAIWKAAPDNDYGRIVKLLMLTAQRREEIGGLAWSEIDKARKLIALPPERTKNSRPHDVPLSDAAMAVLEALLQRVGRALVFGIGKGGYSGWSRSKEALDGAAKLAPWTLHDLRRTAATRMADLGRASRTSSRPCSTTSAGTRAAWPVSTIAAPMRRRNAPRSIYGRAICALRSPRRKVRTCANCTDEPKPTASHDPRKRGYSSPDRRIGGSAGVPAVDDEQQRISTPAARRA